MTKTPTDQAALIKRARVGLKLTTAELADKIGKSRDTLRAWLANKDAAKYRRMPLESRVKLEELLQKRRK